MLYTDTNLWSVLEVWPLWMETFHELSALNTLEACIEYLTVSKLYSE